MNRGLQLAWSGTLAALVLGGGLSCKPPSSSAPVQTEWFVGQVTRTSPDGRIPYSQTEAVLQRQVLEDGRVVEELRTEAPPSPSMPPKQSRLRLVRRGGSRVFHAEGGDPVWVGQATYQDDRLSAWSFALHHKELGPQDGQGGLTGTGLQVIRTIGGSRPMRLVEDYRRVPREEYDRALGLMRPPKGAE